MIRTLLVSICLSLAMEAQTTPRYSVIDLGALPGNVQSLGFALNDSVQAAGRSSGVYNRAVLWSGGAITDLGAFFPATAFSEAHGINSSGQVVGQVNTDGYPRGFLYGNGVMNTLGLLPGGFSSYAHGVNDSGQVVGAATNSGFYLHAVLYTGDVIADLGTLPTGLYSVGQAVNNNGQVTGSAGIAGGSEHAFLYSNGTMTDLGTLPSDDSRGNAINNLGQVVGYSQSSASPLAHAFLYSDGIMTNLGTLGGNTSSAHGINDLSEVVGSSYDGSFNLHAFRYANGGMTDLNSLISPDSGWTLIEARAINRYGAIAGFGYNPSGSVHAFRLDPVVFTIMASAGPGGHISPAGTLTVQPGANQSITITPDSYYHIADVQVDGASVGTITAYTFSNVMANHTISSTFLLVDIAVSSPNSGENWRSGTDQMISWRFINDPGKIVKLELLKAGVVVDTINNGVPIGKSGSGSYKWHVPSKLPPGSDYQVRVTSTTNGLFSDSSDNYFMIF